MDPANYNDRTKVAVYGKFAIGEYRGMRQSEIGGRKDYDANGRIIDLNRAKEEGEMIHI